MNPIKPSPTPTSRVGGNKYTPGSQVLPVAPAPVQQPIQLNPQQIAQLQGILPFVLANTGTVGPIVSTYNYGLLETLTTAQLSEIGRILKKMDFPVKGSGNSIKSTFSNEGVLSTILSRSNTFQELKNNLLRDYVPLGDSGGKENLPTRTISKQDPIVLGEVIDKVYQSNLLRKATAEEKANHIKNFEEDINAGTLTTTKKVKNKKTGKMENVTTVESNFSQAKAETEIEQSLAKLNPDDFDRAKRIQFSDFIMQNTMGGQ